MNTKLTLTLEREVIEKAKQYAKQKGRSLSDMIENYLKAVLEKELAMVTDIPPLIQSLKGAFKASDDMDYKQELSKQLAKKYGS